MHLIEDQVIVVRFYFLPLNLNNMRTKKELYQIFLNHFNSINWSTYKRGLCLAIITIYQQNLISDKEYNLLRKDLLSSKPKWWWIFRFKNNFVRHFTWEDGPYWWTIDSLGHRQRQLFIKYLIKKNS